MSGRTAGAAEQAQTVTITLPQEAMDELVAKVATIVTERQPSASPWLDIAGAAEYTSIPASTIYKNRAIPRHKPDGRLLFHRDELDAYLRGGQ